MRLKTVFLIFILSISSIVFYGQSKGKQLVQAAYEGDHSKVKQLLNQGVTPNAVDDNGYPALIYACAYGYEGIAQMLIDEGASINKIYNDVTPLFAAVRNNNTKTIGMLLDAGAYINAKDKNGYTPLMFAAQQGYKKSVRYLLKRGANINTETDEGHTALSIAIQNDHTDIVKILLKNKPKKKGYSSFTHSPLNTADYLNKKKSQDLLKDYGMKKTLGLPKLDHLFVGMGFYFSPYDFAAGYEGGIHEATYNFDITAGYMKNTDSTLTNLKNDSSTYKIVDGYFATLNKNINLFRLKKGTVGLYAGGFYSYLHGWNNHIGEYEDQMLWGINSGFYYRGKIFFCRVNYNGIFDKKSAFYNHRFSFSVFIKLFSFKNARSGYKYADKTLWMI